MTKPTLIALLLVLAGLGLGLAVMAAVWVVVNRGFGTHRLMVNDLDIYRSANELIKQYGEAADIEATMRADECRAAGDMEGEAVWLRIGKAVEELQRTRPTCDEPMH